MSKGVRYIAIHTHQEGTTCYPFECDKPGLEGTYGPEEWVDPVGEGVIENLTSQLDINFEPNKTEWIDIFVAGDFKEVDL